MAGKLTFRILLWSAVFWSACSLPEYYNDYDSRFVYHDEFHFLAPADRTPILGDSYSFIVVSDIHIGNSGDADDFKNLKSRLTANDKFAVITGDLTDDGTEEQLRLFIDAARSLGIPCYPVIGNHDIYTRRGGPWKELIGSTVYRINVPGTSLFILDNANAAFGYDQLEWLEREIKTAEKNTFVFAHENFFIETSPPDVEQTTDIRERAKVMSLLKNRCLAMFMGHIHKHIVREYGGVQYITLENYGSTGGTGVFCRVRVSGTGASFEFEKALD